MAGLYIHIPFCRTRCIYCGFYSTTMLEQRQRYVDAVCREMEKRGERREKRGERRETIYLGGGTPSQLTIAQLEQLLIYINKVYAPLTNPEITIECNPDDVTVEYAEALTQLGINRVSMGVQTFNDKRLRFLNRRHTSCQVYEAVSHLRQVGTRNISIDLMYGFPNETLDDWERDIDTALNLNVEHISAYCLMVEEGTPLHQMTKGKEATDEETERAMYELLIDKLTAAGYEHYEISNFAKPSYRSRHNSSYWNDIPYIGLGAAAHSYKPHQTSPKGEVDLRTGGVRSWNVSDLKEYIRRIENDESPVEDSELIEGWTHYNDRITVALRTCEGLELNTLTDEQRDYCMKNARRFLDDGLLKLTTYHSPITTHLSLTRKGLFVSDMVMSELMRV